MFFQLHHTDCSSKARAGTVTTDHGTIETPIFMPVGTQASVKTLSPDELIETGAQIILGNTYHLYMRPGAELIQKFGGLHSFMNWNRPILTDSGGYQVFSLKELRKINSEGVIFRSHLDGSKHLFTPESVLSVQQKLGSDIMMVLDECAPHPATYEYAQKSNLLTLEWAKKARELYQKHEFIYGHKQFLFGIVQGSTYEDIRTHSANELVKMDFPGYAVGGLAVGETAEEMYKITNLCTDILPQEKPRYLMGVGMPENIIESIDRGIDMFDCVIPTRNARNGTVFTMNGKMVLKAARFKEDQQPVDQNCSCYTCRNFSRGYMRHLYNVNEYLGLRLATIHNVHFYLQLVREAREHILNDTFAEWKKMILPKITAAL